jgi:hypothetical protein
MVDRRVVGKRRQRPVLGRDDLHVADHLLSLVEPSLADEPPGGLGQLETEQDPDRGEQRADPVHPSPSVGEARPGLGEREAMRPRGRARGQEQAEPDAEQRPQRAHDEDHRDPPCPVAARSDLADVRVDDRQVGTDADAGDHAGQDELRVVGGERVVQRAQAGEEHREQEHVAPADAVGDRGEEERADHVTRQVEDDRHA